MELAQEPKAIHGLDAETELANILSVRFLQKSTEKLLEQFTSTARKGVAVNTTKRYL